MTLHNASEGKVLPSAGSGRFGRTVVFTGGGIGDTLFHLGHFQGIAAQSQDGRIAIACKKGREVTEMLGSAPFVEGVIGLAEDQAVSGKVSIVQAAAQFRARRFETIFCLHDSLSVALAARLAGIRQRIGYAVGGRSGWHLYTEAVPVPKESAHPHWMSKADLLLRALEIPFDTAAARLVPSADALRHTALVRTGQGMIAVGINASIARNQWGGPRFAELVARLAALRPDFAFLLYGAGDVAEVAAIIRARSGLPASRIIDLTSLRCPLGVSHAFLSLCRFYVGNDSSGANLAVFTGIPAITLFGATPPLTYSPLLHAVLPRDTGDLRSMDRISVDAVLERCRPFLEPASAATG